jgi:hypothetical protein
MNTAGEYVKKWCEDNTYLHEREPEFVKGLRASGFDTEHVFVVLRALDNICRHCWDAPAGCQCMNDE